LLNSLNLEGNNKKVMNTVFSTLRNLYEFTQERNALKRKWVKYQATFDVCTTYVHEM